MANRFKNIADIEGWSNRLEARLFENGPLARSGDAATSLDEGLSLETTWVYEGANSGTHTPADSVIDAADVGFPTVNMPAEAAGQTIVVEMFYYYSDIESPRLTILFDGDEAGIVGGVHSAPGAREERSYQVIWPRADYATSRLVLYAEFSSYPNVGTQSYRRTLTADNGYVLGNAFDITFTFDVDYSGNPCIFDWQLRVGYTARIGA